MTTRPTLPQNYILSNVDAFEDFHTVGDWSASYGTGTIEADSINTLFAGKSALKITPTTNVYLTVQKTISAVVYPVNCELWYYVHGNPADIATIGIYLDKTTNSTAYFIKTISTVGIVAGWNRFAFDLASWGVAAGSPLWSDTMIRLKVAVAGVAGKYPAITFGAIYINRPRSPRCVISFDDGFKSVYDNAYPILASAGIKATANPTPNSIDVNPDYMTTAMLDTLDKAGWAIGSHGTMDHTALPDESDLLAVDAWLHGKGYERARKHVAYPTGARNAATLAAMASLGMHAGQTADPESAGYRSGLFWSPATPPQDYFQLPTSVSLGIATTLAAAKTIVDRAIVSGSTIFCVGHNIVETASKTYEWSTADFTALVQYLSDRKIQCVTCDEWYNGLTNPRYRSLPVTRATV